MPTPQKFETLVELLQSTTEKHASRELFGTKTSNGWVWTTYGQFKKLVDDLRGGLASLGVSEGDRVGIIANNRVEWAVAAHATYGLGAAFVPMYESQAPKDWEFIVRDCEAKVVFVASVDLLEKTKVLLETVPTLQKLVVLSAPVSTPDSYAALLARGAQSPHPARTPDPATPCGFIYTSGTTGNPKGVKLSHRNVVSNIHGVAELFHIAETERSLSFLPWAHSFGHTAELHMLMYFGASMALCEAVDKIVDNLAEVRPTVLLAVPRIFNRIYGVVQKQVAGKPKPVRALLEFALRIAKKRRAGEHIHLVEKVAFALADKLIFEKVRARFGGRLKLAISGSAALATEVAEFIDALGITVYEGYGLTETSPVVSFNTPLARRIGSVGKPLPGITVTLDKSVGGDPDQGEIIVHGPNVMLGYHNRPEDNVAVFTPDGGFRTGDLGHLDKDGFLYITERIKEQYKLENGKYVAPGPLEEYLKLSPFIANAMIHGANKPYNVAVIVPNVPALQQWATSHGKSSLSIDALLADETTRSLIREELDKRASHFKRYERVERFVLVHEDFTLQNDMLTPSFKLKRRNVLKKWQSEIDKLYRAQSIAP